MKRTVIGLVLLSFSFVVLSGLMRGADLWINISASVPLGVYKMRSAVVVKGDIVLFCPPVQPVFEEARARGYLNSGFCPGGFGYMIKTVVATAGEMISIMPHGVTVNGVLLPHSQPLSMDGKGRSLPVLMIPSYVLKDQELLIMGQDKATSFDARYFGVISGDQVKAVLFPLLIW